MRWLALLLLFSGCVVHTRVPTHDPVPVDDGPPPVFEGPPVVERPTPPPAHLATPPGGGAHHHPPRRLPRVVDPASFFTPNAPYVGGGSLVIDHWDVGGGNFLRPKAKIGVRVRGRRAHRVALYALKGGSGRELEARGTKNGGYVRFEHKYARGGVAAFEIVLYDSRGRVMAVTRRRP